MKLLRKTLASLALVSALSASAVTYQFVVPLNGSQEAPGPGDPDGSGVATLWIDSELNSISWDITASNIDLPLTGAHIHSAVAGVSGPVVVNFSAQFTGSGLVDADLAGVLANPAAYYVNLHNSVYPGGAIRGQLGRGIAVPDGGLGWLPALMLGGMAWTHRRMRTQPVVG